MLAFRHAIKFGIEYPAGFLIKLKIENGKWKIKEGIFHQRFIKFP